MLRQHIIVGRDSEIAPTDGLLMVGGNSDSRLIIQTYQLVLDEAVGGVSTAPSIVRVLPNYF